MMGQADRMDIRKCYEAFGGDFDEVMSRLLTPARIEKFALRFPEDTSFRDLAAALAADDVEAAFRAAHTMKGVVLNLGFKNLYGVVELTEYLRPGNVIDKDKALAGLETLKPEYEKTVRLLSEYKAAKA